MNTLITNLIFNDIIKKNHAWKDQPPPLEENEHEHTKKEDEIEYLFCILKQCLDQNNLYSQYAIEDKPEPRKKLLTC